MSEHFMYVDLHPFLRARTWHNLIITHFIQGNIAFNLGVLSWFSAVSATSETTKSTHMHSNTGLFSHNQELHQLGTFVLKCK